MLGGIRVGVIIAVASACIFILHSFILGNVNDDYSLADSIECPDYTEYSKSAHLPYSDGPLKIPFMRPIKQCRRFKSSAVESLIYLFSKKMKDPDLFAIFQNTFPNTLDTAILWYDKEKFRSFISTGDIHAQWLRDSTRQLLVYTKFISQDKELKNLVKSTILQQSEFILTAPYCNAFQPPNGSNIEKNPSSIDNVKPVPPWENVFECKWELDSLVSYISLLNEYILNSNDKTILDLSLVQKTLKLISVILRRQSKPTFNNSNGNPLSYEYIFQRQTNIGSETLWLNGLGNPVNSNTGLVKSAFRPSDDACIFQFLIPSNIYLLSELNKLIPLMGSMKTAISFQDGITLQTIFEDFSKKLENGINEYGIIQHPEYGEIFAYEVDGYGSHLIMDDANLPSLLSIPEMAYPSLNRTVYENTRKVLLSKGSNPYYMMGKYLSGIGGPHIGVNYAWPMSLLVQIRTSDDDAEILQVLEMLKTTTAGLGLMHEGIDVNSKHGLVYTRPWFSWCNSEFAQTILELAERKPWLIFK